MSKVMERVKAIGLARALRVAAAVADAIADAAEREPGVRAEKGGPSAGSGQAEVKLFGRRVPVRAVVELVRSLRRARVA